ncbi:hypothetical protein [Natrinema versiforme]|uniref:Uncharacterized protein n=1 Tax=Natrinema versiforme TaxID=88724 RepID=A0A4P8WLG0_9EURY|nr:hypothetical protein [Natrinema versiforme]QCS44418.1 hypothetical protein FEJ81_18885 [Natrinema versiforme]
MATRMATRLENFFEQRTDGHLRSIVKYEENSYEIVYLRDDVAEQYTTEEIESAIDDSRMESLTAPIYEDTYSGDHGNLTCLVQCFENVIEMNFVLEDGVGAAVALDAKAMADAHGLVAEARRIVLEERE